MVDDDFKKLQNHGTVQMFKVCLIVTTMTLRTERNLIWTFYDKYKASSDDTVFAM